MQITIDTSKPLSTEDRELIALLIGVDSTREVVTEPAEKPAPAKRPAAKPAPAKKVVEEPEPEPEEDDLLGSDDTVTREQVVERVTDMVSAGKKAEVREALKTVKAAKVSDIPDEKLQAFWDSLPD